jgi:hypothetical protein
MDEVHTLFFDFPVEFCGFPPLPQKQKRGEDGAPSTGHLWRQTELLKIHGAFVRGSRITEYAVA